MRRFVSVALLCLLSSAGLHAGDSPQPTFHDAITVTEKAPLLIPVDFGQGVVVDFGIGELALAIAGADTGQVRTELVVRCKELTPERCDSYRQRLKLVAKSADEKVSVCLTGLSSRKMRKLDIDSRIIVPRWAPVEVRMGIGDLDIETSGDKDLVVGMRIGELTIHVPKEKISTVDLGVGIGDAWVQGQDVHVEGQRRKLLGARARWESGEGATRIVAHLGIGDVGVVLE
jgi:hypothetical protein